jgi:alpha-mannosidase
MLARAARLRDLDGSATVHIETPEDFFTRASAEYPDAPVWVGELYLEMHRGTYTSQLRTKQGNRRSEHLLREAELWCATAAVRTGADYPYEALDRIWKLVLLQQFHDILPGSSINWVHREAVANYAAVAGELHDLIAAAQRGLAGAGSGQLVFNAAPHARDGVPALGAVAVAVPSLVAPEHDGDGWLLENDLLRVRVDNQGLITSVFDLAAEREVLAPGSVGNLLQLHPDTPVLFDAWDIDQYYRNTSTDLVEAFSVEVADGGVRVVRRFGDSTITQVVSLPVAAKRVDVDTEIDWHESEKLLKAGFDLDVTTERSAAEIQFGHVYRPTHRNTSWDAAKFEICAHRWVHVSEPGYGVAVVNDSTYGHDVTRRERAGGGMTTMVRLSLVRAPRSPDPVADQGLHRLRYALVPGAGILDAVREGYAINLPLRQVSEAAHVAVLSYGEVDQVRPLITVDNDGVVVESVKLADDESGDVVVRVYEAQGGRARARVGTSFEYRDVHGVDLLERPRDEPGLSTDAGEVVVALRPFQILTLRFTR